MEKKFLDEVIDKREGAFLSGKSLMHGVVVANEVIDKARRKKKSCLVFKVDYKKAYDDFISSCFLAYMFQRLGFKEKWWLDYGLVLFPFVAEENNS